MNDDKFVTAVITALLGFFCLVFCVAIMIKAYLSHEVYPKYERDSRTGLCFARAGQSFTHVPCDQVLPYLED